VKYAQEQQVGDHRRVFRAIAGIWAVSILLGMPILLGLNHDPSDPRPSECAFNNPDFILFSSIASFYIPCVIMVFLYARIFKVGSQPCVFI